MSFTMLLLMGYAILLACLVTAVATRHGAVAICLGAVMAVSLIVLAALWITSPM